MRGCAVAIVLCGCGFSSSPGNPIDAADPIDGSVTIDGPTIDAAPPVDAKPEALCAGTIHKVCLDPPPTNTVTLPNATLDTGTSTLCMTPTSITPNVTACVIIGASITLPQGAKLNVIGTKPLILLAGAITISGTIDAASHRGGQSGPGADGTCATNQTAPNTGGGRADGGGGWGGSFGGKGGDGGRGADDGAAGKAGDTVNATTLRGGCPGGDGAGNAGAKGHGGGALALLAKTSISIDGIINASGSAGGGSPADAGGGGGGGTGGMIILEAPAVTVAGQCFANGGGGGEGANVAADGLPGGESTSPNRAGAGGADGTDFGGNGGAGAVGNTASGGGVTGTAGGGGAVGGGGGGGGGVGIIRVVSANQTGTTDLAKVSPAPTAPPGVN